MDAEAKNFEGLKEKTNYSQVKAGSGLAGKGINGALSVTCSEQCCIKRH
jgi:hypothetical protein